MNKKFKECLLEVYLGEQAGEMVFESMLTMAEDDNQRYIFSNMLQLETAVSYTHLTLPTNREV